MGGMSVFERDQDGSFIPQYLNFIISPRTKNKDLLGQKIILNIAQETKYLYEEYYSWLNDTFSAYLEELDEENHGFFFYPGRGELRELTVKECLSGSDGKIVGKATLVKVV